MSAFLIPVYLVRAASNSAKAITKYKAKSKIFDVEYKYVSSPS